MLKNRLHQILEMRVGQNFGSVAQETADQHEQEDVSRHPRRVCSKEEEKKQSQIEI